MFPKKIIFGFSILLFLLTIPFMFVRIYFDKDPYISTAVIFEHINDYDAWDSFSATLNSLITTNNVFGEAVEYFKEFSQNSLWDNILGIGDLLYSFFSPFFLIFEFLWHTVSFIGETIVWVLELFAIVADYNFLSYHLII